MRPCLCETRSTGKCHFCELAARSEAYRKLFERWEHDERIDFRTNLTPEQIAAIKALPNIDCC